MSLAWDGYASDRDRPFCGDPDEFDEDPANIAPPQEREYITEVTADEECRF